MIHVVAVARLGGSTMASSVMGDNAIAVFEEEQHLCVPVIGRERPAVAEDDGLSFTPVFIIDVDVSFVFFSDSYVWHCNFSFWLVVYDLCCVSSWQESRYLMRSVRRRVHDARSHFLRLREHRHVARVQFCSCSFHAFHNPCQV